MNTYLSYYDKPLQQTAEASVIQVAQKGSKQRIILDETLFYPGGGGQLPDRGRIIGENGILTVEKAFLENGRIVHEGTISGTIADFDTVQVELNWAHRLTGMKLHSAGHALHEALLTIAKSTPVPMKAEHNRDPYIQYSGCFEDTDPLPLEKALNELIASNPKITMRQASLDEIKASCRFVPPNLPYNKPLRVVQIGLGELVPCGGVHLMELGEAGKIKITAIRHCADRVSTKIQYELSKD